MCNCITEIEAKMHEYAGENNKGDVQTGKLLHTQLPFTMKSGTGKVGERTTYSEYHFKYAPRKKDGTIGMHKNTIINTGHTFCPWCGLKYPEL